MAYKRPFTLAASQAVTATGSLPATTGYNVGAFNAIRLYLNVTAVTGTTPTLVANVMGKDPNGAWVQLAQFNNGSNITATGEFTVALTTVSRIIRVDVTVGGTTPSFTLSVSGDGETYGD